MGEHQASDRVSHHSRPLRRWLALEMYTEDLKAELETGDKYSLALMDKASTCFARIPRTVEGRPRDEAANC